MPTILLNKQVFQKLVGKEIPLDELKDRISMLGTDLEKIEGNEIEVEIFPNRPDMLSEQGFARAFSSFIGVKTGLREYTVKESLQKVNIKNVQVRPYTACAIIKNLTLDDEKLREIIQLQEKLHITYGRHRKKCAIGIYPLEKIKFPITYTSDLPGNISFQPLEVDQKMSALEILQNHKAGKEFGHLLEKCEKYPYFIDANNEILSMPPIINSHNTGRVTEATKDLFIECSGFEFETLSICLNIIVTSLADMGGDILSLTLDYENEEKITPNLKPQKMDLNLNYINKRLGLELSEKEVIELLKKMGFGYDNKVLIPAYRADILHQVDLVEDIAIAYGYENFAEEIPNVSTIGQEDSTSKFANKVREILIGLQLLEAKNYHLMTQLDLVDKMNLTEEIIPLKNALGEHNHLRNSVTPCLLKNLTENQHHEYPQNLFEIGRTFTFGDTETGVLERDKLSVVLCHDKADFTEIRQILDGLMLSLGVEYKVVESSHASYIPGRVAQVIIGDKIIGVLGELHPKVLNNWDINVPTVAMELDLEMMC
jgi:phenylalanyl-tRNA synthetase beta chain